MSFQHIRELVKYRNLIWVLAWVEFKQRYKNSILGYFWSLLEPLFMFAILYLVFSSIIPAQVEYYPLFLLQGIIMWSFFTRSTTASLVAISDKPQMVKKVYFPRDILVISGCITTLLMSFFESIVFLAFLLYFRIPLSMNALYIPVIIFLFFVIVLGTSLILSALNVFYRDIRYIWALVLQVGFFATPVIYPLSIFPPQLLQILSYNPLAQVIFLARDVTLYSRAPNISSFLFVIVMAGVILGIGYAVFMRLEPRFAEEL
ncbi:MULTISPECIES: ABC transporter permease [unclassified Methanoregula]|uniref:ABC transporter permease n=1 Tax=unclassified Methanoregula TaxID=2649730 RepID=UPI0009D00E4D|nr:MULTISPECIES: ABC transporter permease [unclassified Methanoregula]OPX65147.1 MAG: ABC-2 type transporter [Methanoregula sp. PtaB.Bin085]OPY32059.1 MAG: ABC-2 type transporter [Methanoregula sp. PtaU1.Bin006]